MECGHSLRAELWQPGKVPSQWHQNSHSLLQTQPWAGFRGSRGGPGISRSAPSNRKRGKAANPQPLGRSGFLLNEGHQQNLGPSCSLSPPKLFTSILSSLKPIFSGAPSKELTEGATQASQVQYSQQVSPTRA